jgi:hypothetical protein
MKALRQIGLAVAVLLPMLHGADNAYTSGSVHLQFTTRPTGQKYSPRHVMAVWVADAKGGFVRTLMLRAKRQRGRLLTWQKSAAGNTAGLTDATTGATLRLHETITLDWDCRDAAGKPVPDGSYQIMIEFSERNGAGPVTPWGYLRVEKGKLPFTVKPKNLTYFSDLQVTFAPPTAAAATPPLPAPQVAPAIRN